jgi:L-fuconolactonase
MTADGLALGVTGAGPVAASGIVDSHVHFWDPSVLEYPWLDGLPALGRPFLPADYAAATAGIPIGSMIVVEANCVPDHSLREAELF